MEEDQSSTAHLPAEDTSKVRGGSFSQVQISVEAPPKKKFKVSPFRSSGTSFRSTTEFVAHSNSPHQISLVDEDEDLEEQEKEMEGVASQLSLRRYQSDDEEDVDDEEDSF